MQLSKLLLATGLFTTSIIAAPVPNDDWTIENMKRVCNHEDTSCTWTFGINRGIGITSCTYVVKGAGASHASGGPKKCGKFSISSGWSGQFDPENGFTVLSVVDDTTGKLIWPSYDDNELKDGNVVNPDKTYTSTIIA
ncbi:hypothetical protein N7457_009330 [Penicillium paradoxum]|uniref:uncharacterized protein n=1 Tax=Penicillium paradoxum TaxID=176176 RepID=UPI0025482956|nr:uncharacterized protein N7457_009330 [Penicillium paradoxum]KAJ5774434.1 hypothetical protein N7457_009330 [Penicillium paradoxum]